MTSVCISNCVKDARVPVRATYVNLYKWPESDAEFIRSMSSNMRAAGDGGVPHPRVVDSISCRQLYLRSYTFSREENKKEETVKCYGRGREGVGEKRTRRRRKSRGRESGSDDGGRRRRKKCVGLGKVKEVSSAVVVSIFRRLLSCTTKVDVVG
ncbi:PREDICTED: uncharacterized protein LOC109192926 [Ipomoea nil]|uniref:uncharacterized protein LOC109192926 n=1 Tax=Ipomoea nil TaxID=35883 RepID=UPI000900D328|nr:PREDICTED: uncharacterized protein LOC109192926 [Ipomoea nil]